MKGYIYIAGSFQTVNRPKPGQQDTWLDNDPHFWTDPPTWGICRNDLRAGADAGDVVFFVLPKRGVHPQSIFGYLTIKRIVTHARAYHMTSLRSKRMANKNPNGNIIVDYVGRYNRFDGGDHLHKFNKVKRHYAIGDTKRSRFLTHAEISALAPTFVTKLSQVISSKSGARPIDFITRKGAELSRSQVEELLAWLNQKNLTGGISNGLVGKGSTTDFLTKQRKCRRSSGCRNKLARMPKCIRQGGCVKRGSGTDN